MEEKQNIFERIKLYITKPSTFFLKYKKEPKYLFHLIILSIIACVSSLISKYVNANAYNDLLNQSTSGLSGQELEMANSITGFFSSPIVVIFSTLIITIIGYYIVSLIYYLIVGKIFKGEGTFNHMVVLMLLASYPVNLLNLARSFSPTNLDMSFFNTLTASVNLFSIWQLILMILGTSVLFNISKKKSSIIFIVLFVVGVLLSLWTTSGASAIQY